MTRKLPADFSIPTAHVSIPAHVVYREFAAETVILNLETGRYHGLNATGGGMLELLDRCDSVAEALTAFAGRYGKEPVEVEEDLRAFCTRLHERGLIDVTLNGSR
ncbi:MAG: PqqD family protein [Gaiellaceae bacterium MAG52_C11]|nr:PqqD family protein [Candidatus Gaiellasilicea maunaloa]